MTWLYHIFVAGLAAAVASPAPAADTRFAGDPLLGGAGARSLAMGSAYVALSHDATAVYWNPSGLGRLKGKEILAQHAEQFGGAINHDLVSFAGETAAGGIGLSVVRVGVDGIPLTTLEDASRPLGADNRPVIEQLGGTSDYAAYIGFGRLVLPRISVGLALKLIWRNLMAGDGSGYGFDVGAHITATQHVSFGLTIRDLTRTRISFDSGTRDDINPSALLGVAYARDIRSIHGALIFSASFHAGEDVSSAEGQQALRFGTEYAHHLGPAIRLGLNGNHLTAGAGFRFRDRFGADLAFLEDGDLDNTLRLSASLYFR